MNIVVAGTGYVGLVTGVCLAEKGHNVTCVDVDKEKIKMMKSGDSPIYEPNLSELMKKNSDRLNYTLNAEEAYAQADVIFVGVGTPEMVDGSANLKYVYEVVDEIKSFAKSNSVVVIKSTVPIGTNDEIDKALNANKEKRFYVVSNPEFLSQGTAVYDTLNASRIVIGTDDEYAKNIMLEIYKNFDAPKLITDRKSAEMIKYASNDFLALKISYINEIANLCEIVGANVDDVAKGMGYDKRIGSRFLKAGIGYGGSCFPKDTKALNWFAANNDYELCTVKAAIEVNEKQKYKLIKKLKQHFNSFDDVTIAVLGLTFKPGTDDLREAPSLVIVPVIYDYGANIRVWDRIGEKNFKKIFNKNITYCQTPAQALEGADVCLVLTEWDEIKALKAEDFINQMNNPLILDGRNCLDNSVINSGIIQYEGIGKINERADGIGKN